MKISSYLRPAVLAVAALAALALNAAPIPAELGPKLAAAAATLPYGPHVSLVVDVDG